MRNSWTLFLLLATFSLSAQHFSNRKVLRLLKDIPIFEQAHIAFRLEPLYGDKPIAAYQDTHYMTPASNTKLFTFLAAIQEFDSLPALAYFQENDSLIHFKSTGYPLLFHPFYQDDSLASFFNQKKVWNYHPPKRPINTHGPGWSWDDYSYYYAAERSPFPIYGNTTQIFGNPDNPQFLPKYFQNQLILDSLVRDFHREPNQNKFRYNPAVLNLKDTLYRPFITDDLLFVNLLKEAINQPVILEKEQENLPWKNVYTHQESLLYRGLLQDSDNGIAEALLAMISENRFGEMTIPKVLDSIQSGWKPWLPDTIEWVDGSGISRYNMTTPRTLIAILKQINNQIGIQGIKTYFPESTLSGTLKNYPLKNVFAKTGTLRHNHNLSGYWISPKGPIYVFSIMVNHFTSPTNEVRKGISELLLRLQKKL